MKSVISLIIALSNILAIAAFTVQQPPAMPPAALERVVDAPVIASISTTQPNSIHQYLTSGSAIESSTNVVSLQERKVPTAEEIAAKKRNFNLWFWGGGFVAPFLATFYYFGLKFWEK